MQKPFNRMLIITFARQQATQTRARRRRLCRRFLPAFQIIRYDSCFFFFHSLLHSSSLSGVCRHLRFLVYVEEEYSRSTPFARLSHPTHSFSWVSFGLVPHSLTQSNSILLFLTFACASLAYEMRYTMQGRCVHTTTTLYGCIVVAWYWSAQ